MADSDREAGDTDPDLWTAADTATDTDGDTVTGTDGRRYWLPPSGADGDLPSRRRNPLRWLLGAGLLVLVTLVVGVFVLGHALDGISTSPQTQVVDDYAKAVAHQDSGAVGRVSCEVDRSEVIAATQGLLTGRAAPSAERRGALHRDSEDTEHATVRLARNGAGDVDLTVSIARVSGSWCVVSVAPAS